VDEDVVIEELVEVFEVDVLYFVEGVGEEVVVDY